MSSSSDKGRQMALVAFQKALSSIVIFLLLVPLTIHAQNSTPSTAQGNQPAKEPSNPGVYNGRDVFVPDTQEPKETEPAASSFSDGFLRNTRRHFGLSV